MSISTLLRNVLTPPRRSMVCRSATRGRSRGLPQPSISARPRFNERANNEPTWALTRTLGTAPRLFAFGPERVQRIGIVTGSGGSLIPQVAAAGLDTFVTGEGQHWTFFDAEELGLNVFYAGHYATETVGVKALAEHVAKKFDLPWVFLDHPTGL